MAKRVYFAFHYQDVIDFRANVVRNHWLTKPDRESAGFFDASVWEKAKKTSDLAVKRLINNGLKNTSVTAVLIGTGTYLRRWVRYEIFKSIDKGNKIIGVHINQIKDRHQNRQLEGKNPFDYLGFLISSDGRKLSLFEYNNKGKWQRYKDLEHIQLSSPLNQNLRGSSYSLSKIYKIYDWIGDDGYNNFAKWVQ